MSLVNIARYAVDEDGKTTQSPGPTARATQEAFEELYRERGYGVVDDSGEWVEQPLAEDDAAAGSAATTSTPKGA